ncbi:MAG: ECF-type sigma factor [Acidobacteriota bacterium]
MSHEAVGADLTALLRAWEAGDEAAGERLVDVTYRELRGLARARLRAERGAPLDTTELVHEAFLRFVGRDTDWSSRAHFFGTAARAMRQVLVDLARRRRADKRDAEVVTLADGPPGAAAGDQAAPLDVLALDRALERLASVDERKGRVVELRYFGGFSIAETAAALDLSTATVERDLRAARAWLASELTAGLEA